MESQIITYTPIASQKKLYESVHDDVENRATLAVLPNGGYRTGACHEIWDIMKVIFKDEYSIDWQSPDDLNPNCFFD